jgi:hypothetical protein
LFKTRTCRGTSCERAISDQRLAVSDQRAADSGQRSTPQSAILLLTLVLLLLPSCAKVAEPVAPEPRIPPTTTEVRLQQEGPGVLLTFPEPAQDIQAIEIFRRCGTPVEAGHAMDLVARVERQQWEPAEPGQFLVRDRLPALGCLYALRFVDRRGRSSPLSNFVRAPTIVPAKPPSNLSYVVESNRIVLSWDPPAANIDSTTPPNIAGYLVNALHFVREPEFVDRDFRSAEERTYRVQTVTQAADPLVVSSFSAPVSVLPIDVFPPPAPTGLSAIQEAGVVQLVWDPSPAPDLQGYYVYRGSRPDALEKVSSKLPVNAYQDRVGLEPEVYLYQVSAVDRAGNESPRSDPVRIEIEN